MTKQYSDNVADLLAEVQKHYPQPIQITVTPQASGNLTHDQSEQVMHKDGSLEIHIKDRTNVDYTLSHELLHMLLGYRGFSEISFPVSSGVPQMDEQIGATATSLYNSAAHILILEEQQAHGILNDTVAQDFMAGLYEAVPMEDANHPNDQLLIYRMLSLLDALVFANTALGDVKNVHNVLITKYPQALEYAEALYGALTAKKVTDPFSFRRAVIAAFKAFREIINRLNFVPMNHAQFAVLEPVYSKRQLRLSLNQVVEVLHSEYTDLTTKQRAYIAIGKNDEQAAFVFRDLPEDMSAEQFQALYQENLETVLTQEHVSYGIR